MKMSVSNQRQIRYNLSMFAPTEIIFSCTTACNLRCRHCFIDRNPASLKEQDAISFLKSAAGSENSQIGRVGFSGGEPFLSAGFLEKVIAASVDSDLMFDRIMTNGDWWRNEDELRKILRKIYDAGYDGKICLSYDNFHGQEEEHASMFIKNVWEIFGGASLEIQSVSGDFPSRQKNPSAQELLRNLANGLGLTFEEKISESGRGAALLRDETHFLPAYIQTESRRSTDGLAWRDEKWFEDDFCQSMGQILFVHATGKIAPCCGFANENESLLIGEITDSFDTVLQKAGENPMIRLCFEEGLSGKIPELQKKGKLPPGKTEDICAFCDYICKSGI